MRHPSSLVSHAPFEDLLRTRSHPGTLYGHSTSPSSPLCPLGSVVQTPSVVGPWFRVSGYKNVSSLAPQGSVRRSPVVKPLIFSKGGFRRGRNTSKATEVRTSRPKPRPRPRLTRNTFVDGIHLPVIYKMTNLIRYLSVTDDIGSSPTVSH